MNDGLATGQVFFDGTFSSPRLDHAESVAVAADGALWCGGEEGQLYRLENGVIEQVASTGGFNLGLSFGPDGDLFVCDIAKPAVWRLPAGSREPMLFGTSWSEHTLLTPNFPLALPDGSVLISDSGIAHEPRVGLIRYYQDGRSEIWHDQELNFANGLALSPNSRTLYVAESWSYRVLAIDLTADFAPEGTVRTHATTDGYIPDGLGIAPNGDLYVGCYEPSAILRITADGQSSLFAQDQTAHLLCHPTGVAVAHEKLIVANLGRWHLTSFAL